MKKLILAAGLLSVHFVSAQPAVKGYVYEDQNENGKRDRHEEGIAGVGVSNGVEVTLTDEKGRYKLPVADDNIIFVIKPAGHRTAVDENTLPQFYYIHKPQGSPDLKYEGVAPTGKLPKSVDFALIPDKEHEKFTAVIFGDPQVRNENDVDYFNRGIINELEGIEGVAWGMSLGDLTGNQLNLFDPYIQAVRRVGIPWYNLMGNHDINKDAANDIHSDETFEAHFGPANYSFNYGEVHFIVLDNILYKDPGSKRRVDGGFRTDQLQFMKNDLKHVSADNLVVLSFHIPLYNLKDKVQQKLFDVLEEFPRVLVLTGHAHQQRQAFFTKNDGSSHENPLHEYNVGATCGAWYSGIENDEGIPRSMMKDGTPKGYAFITFDGNEYVIDYKVADMPENYRIDISAPKVVAHNARTSAAIYANFFMGSSNDTLRYRIDNGKWKIMKYTRDHDPAYVHMLHRWDYSETLLKGRRPGEPVMSTHLWKAAPIPTDLSPGVHTIEVKVTDMFGRTFIQSKTYRIEVPDKPPFPSIAN